MRDMFWWTLGFVAIVTILDPAGCAREVGRAISTFKHEASQP